MYIYIRIYTSNLQPVRALTISQVRQRDTEGGGVLD